MNVHDIAKIVHSVNRGYCLALGDNSQVEWDQAPDNIKQSAIDGVNFILNNFDAGPSASHDNWLKFKKADGWKYAPIKDADKKEHPCFIPYNELPVEQRAKDYIFTAVVKSLLIYLDDLQLKEQKPVTIDPNRGVVDAKGIRHEAGEDGKRYADLSGMRKKPV